MADYTCVPAARTVSPCPTGTAPQVALTSAEPVTPYPALFDHIAVQDVMVGLAMAMSLLLGIGNGRR